MRENYRTQKKKVPSLSEEHDMKCQFRLRVSIMSVDSFHWKFPTFPLGARGFFTEIVEKWYFHCDSTTNSFFCYSKKKANFIIIIMSTQDDDGSEAINDQLSHSASWWFSIIAQLAGRKMMQKWNLIASKCFPDTGSSWPSKHKMLLSVTTMEFTWYFSTPWNCSCDLNFSNESLISMKNGVRWKIAQPCSGWTQLFFFAWTIRICLNIFYYEVFFSLTN